jgi:CRISPR-associated protein Cas10/Cmr2 subtype III-B
MIKHLAIFQVGPVQDFINCAKRTQDYLAGSLIISYLTSIGMASVESDTPKGEIVYPFHTNDRIYGEAIKVLSNGGKPNLRGAPLYGTVPNRFVATFNSEMNPIKKVLSKAEEEVRKKYADMLQTAKKALENSLQTKRLDLDAANGWNDLWDRYLHHGAPYLEVYWVISPYEDSSYRDDYQKAELLFGARKGLRDFAQVEEFGAKCTLCGQREQLSWDKDARAFWQELRSLNRFKFLFREGERLCALCTAKRLAPEEYFGLKDISFPSTSTMAVSSALLKLAEKRMNASIANCIAEFQQNFEEMKLERFPMKLTPLNLIKEQFGSLKPSGIFTYDGDAFIFDTYQSRKIYKEYGSSYGQDELEFIEKVTKAEKSLRKLLKAVDVEEAPKYYAVVSIDGDDMGKWLDGSNTNGRMDLDLHKQISQKLSQYASEEVPKLSEKKYLAKVVYFGGDEGVILCSLEDLLPMMFDLHEAYVNTFVINGKSGTNSMGGVIAHHQQSLLQVMAEARDALHEAKRVKYGSDEKNAFCVSLMKRSGGTVRIPGKFEMLKHLKEMIEFYQKKEISPQWVYALDAICPTFQEVTDSRLLNGMIAEVKRILRRHFHERLDPSQKEAILDKLIPEIEKIVHMLKDIKVGSVRKNDLKSLMDLEYLSVYIARGGGR